VTAKEFQQVLSEIDFNSLTDEELALVHDEMSTKLTSIKCILIRRKHIRIHHPLPKDNRTD